MLIECSHCQTRFNVADHLIKPGGIKIRCAKCKEIFPVSAPQEPAQTPLPDFDAAAEQDFFEHPRRQAPEPAAEDALGDIRFDEELETEVQLTGETRELPDDLFGDLELSGEPELPPEPEAPPAPDAEMDELFTALAKSVGVAEEPADSGAQETDPADIPDLPFERELEDYSSLDEFSFDEEKHEPISLKGPSEPELARDEASGYDYNDNFAFDEEALGSDGSEFSFDEEKGKDPFASDYSFDEEPQEPLNAAASSVEEYSFDESEGEQEEMPLPFAEVKLEAAPGASSYEPPVEEEIGLSFKDSPPLDAAAPAFKSPASPEPREPGAPRTLPAGIRKKPKAKFSKARLVAALLILLVVGGAAGISTYLQRGPAPFRALVDRVFGTSPPVVDKGAVSTAELSGFYMINLQAGELFVVTGKAVNEYSQPRANIQLKGVLYAKDGKLLRQQTVYAGNPIRERDLRTLPMKKIQEAMNNQFGEALSNLSVPPGAQIPFAIVFHDLPEDLAEFAVEVVDSRPASE